MPKLAAFVLGSVPLPEWIRSWTVRVVVTAATAGYVGWRRKVTNPLALTRQTLKEDVRWMKERLV